MKTKKLYIATWLGRASTPSSLDKILSVQYSNDGDFLGSDFSRAFKLGRYNDDLREARRFNSPPKSIQHLLDGVSYEADAIPAIVRAGATMEAGDNCFVCLYDFKAPQNTVAFSAFPGVSLRFAGVGSFVPKIPESKW